MAVQLQDRKRATSGLKSWLDDIAAYERAFKSWEGRVEKILKRYKDEPRAGQTQWTSAKFNILWSNVQTLSAATFSRLPKPDVSRRYRDQDPVGRVAALILERDLDYHVQHYPEYRTALKAAVLDRFLGARGTSWVRYEPHFRAGTGPVDGDQVTDDVDTPDEELDYECVAVDYVHWKDFGHTPARTWEEVNRVWRKVYLTREGLAKRFGEQIAVMVPLDADPRQTAPDKVYGAHDQRLCATIFEGWDKSKKQAVWFSKAVKDFLDVTEFGDPSFVDFEDGFPCPRPLFGTLTNDSLVPVPDFVVYQDQANELDMLSDRINGLIKALKVCGGYDASVPELGRIFTEANNTDLIPIKNWQAFAEKNGLVGALSLVDLKPIADALVAAYEAFEQVKNQVYELTGISDIIRGQTEAGETATAQQIKGQYASLRLKTYQDEVARYASDTLSLMAQVICRKFSPETIAKVAGVDQLMPQDQQVVPQALALLVGPQRMMDPDAEEGPNPVREFRIEVAADSMVHLDEQAEQQARVEFLGAVGTYLENVAKAMQGVPPQMAAVLLPLLMDMLKFGVTGYRVGKQIQGAFDEAADRLKQLAAAAPPPDPEEMRKQVEGQVKAELEAKNAQKEIKVAQREADLDIRELKFNAQQEIASQQQQFQQQALDQQNQFAAREQEMTNRAAAQDVELGVNEKLAKHREGVTQMVGKVKEENAKANADQVSVEAAETKNAKRDSQVEKLVREVTQSTVELQKDVRELVKSIAAPKRITRGSDGRATGLETVR